MTREQEQLAVELDGLAQRMYEYFQQVLDSINRIADVYGLRELAAKAKAAAEAETDATPPPPEPEWKPGQYVKLTNPDTKERVIAERSDDNAGWLIPGAVIIYGDNEVTDVEPVAALTAEDARDLGEGRGIGSFERFFRERGLDL